MLNYHITTEAEKKLIAGWAYPRDYAIYDLPSYETAKKARIWTYQSAESFLFVL